MGQLASAMDLGSFQFVRGPCTTQQFAHDGVTLLPSFSKRVAQRYGFLASTVCKRQWLPMAQVHQGHWPNMQSRHLPHRLGEICTKPSISLLFVYFYG